jgi:hypothetical protein
MLNEPKVGRAERLVSLGRLVAAFRDRRAKLGVGEEEVAVIDHVEGRRRYVAAPGDLDAVAERLVPPVQ